MVFEHLKNWSQIKALDNYVSKISKYSFLLEICTKINKKTPNKHQMKQDDSGKIVIHEMKSLISIVYTSLLF